jgi:hypothetical protein
LRASMLSEMVARTSSLLTRPPSTQSMLRADYSPRHVEARVRQCPLLSVERLRLFDYPYTRGRQRTTVGGRKLCTAKAMPLICNSDSSDRPLMDLLRLPEDAETTYQ